MSVFVDHKLKLTYEDLKQIPEDDPSRHEILDGMHVASPSPVYRHQTISRRLQFQLYRRIELEELGDVVNAPMDVELSIYDVVEPDILVVLAPRSEIVQPSHVVGAPDLVVEILSPITTSRDLGIKRRRYEVNRVPEYWIIDPDDESVLVLKLDPSQTAQRYREVGRYHESLTFTFEAGAATVDLLAVFPPDRSTEG